jgi:hypothetical protein
VAGRPKLLTSVPLTTANMLTLPGVLTHHRVSLTDPKWNFQLGYIALDS